MLSLTGVDMSDPMVEFCHTRAGPRVAYASAGTGPPLVMVPGWLTHVTALWGHPAACEIAGIAAASRRSPLSRCLCDAHTLRGHISTNGEVVERATQVSVGQLERATCSFDPTCALGRRSSSWGPADGSVAVIGEPGSGASEEGVVTEPMPAGVLVVMAA